MKRLFIVFCFLTIAVNLVLGGNIRRIVQNNREKAVIFEFEKVEVLLESVSDFDFTKEVLAVFYDKNGETVYVQRCKFERLLNNSGNIVFDNKMSALYYDFAGGSKIGLSATYQGGGNFILFFTSGKNE